jgi:hypothetical protein
MSPDTARRLGGWSAVAYGLALVVVVVVVGVVLAGAVPDPAELLADVTRRRELWVASQALLAMAQALLVPVVVALVVVLGPAERLAVGTVAGFLGLAATSFVASGVFHGVLGVHLVHKAGVAGAPIDVVLAEVELVHAFGDTFWFAGIAGLALATVAATGPIRRSPGLPGGLAVLGLAAVTLDLVQLLWFFVPEIGAAGAVGAVLHAAWFVWLGTTLARAAMTNR